ncbi:hypothetical protein AALB39_05635 [Lachnospiraceae bacterium 54-53]
MNGKDFIKDRLKKEPAIPTKQLNITLDTRDVDNLEKIAALLTKETSQTTTRNELIKTAIKGFLAESVEELEAQGYDLDIDDASLFPYDTLILPAHQEGFIETFLGDNKWFPIRANDYKIRKMKYIAIYVGAPVSAITHYGKLKEDGILFDEDTERYTVLLDGPAKQLPHAIPLGNINAAATRYPRYVKLSTLLSADTYEDLSNN